jgi:cbb3-type cytochrome oxidase subunit 3
MRVSCNGHQYHFYYRLAQALVVVVALGFPVLVWYTLYRAHTKEKEARERAWEAEYDEDTDDLASIRASTMNTSITRDEQMMKFAYTGHYHKQFYYWEPLDMVRKLMLTGLITFLGKGTVSQLFVAILVT